MQILSTPGDDVLWGVAPDVNGNAVALWYAASENALRLDRPSKGVVTPLKTYLLSVSSQLGSTVPKVDGAGLTAGPTGPLYLTVSTFNDLPGGRGVLIDIGGGQRSGQEVAALEPDGTFVKDAWGCGFGLVATLAGSARGDVVVWREYAGMDVSLAPAGQGCGAGEISLFGGAPAGGPLATMGCWAAAFTPDGGLLCGGASQPNGTPLPFVTSPGSPGFALRPTVAKLDLAGHVLWTRVIPVVGMVTQVGVTARGTVVAAGLFQGSGQFGSDTLDSPATSSTYAGFLVAAEADGSPRWARALSNPALALAVDPAGRAAVATAHDTLIPNDLSWLTPYRWEGEAGDGTLLYYDLAGTFHWKRTIPARVAGIAIRDHDVLVGGTWSGTFDFGLGPVTSAGDDAFVLDVAP